MTAMDHQGVAAELRTTSDGATATAPRVVNGLTERPRERVNLWGCLGIVFLPDIALLLVVIGIGIHRMLRPQRA